MTADRMATRDWIVILLLEGIPLALLWIRAELELARERRRERVEPQVRGRLPFDGELHAIADELRRRAGGVL